MHIALVYGEIHLDMYVKLTFSFLIIYSLLLRRR
jgi:hypothetical protein